MSERVDAQRVDAGWTAYGGGDIWVLRIMLSRHRRHYRSRGDAGPIFHAPSRAASAP